MDKGKLGHNHVLQKREFQATIGGAKPTYDAMVSPQPFICLHVQLQHHIHFRTSKERRMHSTLLFMDTK